MRKSYLSIYCTKDSSQAINIGYHGKTRTRSISSGENRSKEVTKEVIEDSNIDKMLNDMQEPY